MNWQIFREFLLFFQHTISFIGILVIVSGVILALFQYIQYLITRQFFNQEVKINEIRLKLGRILILGLEFIVAADLIASTTTPDYYSLGIVAIIVAIRTFLSFSLSREIDSLNLSKNDHSSP